MDKNTSITNNSNIKSSKNPSAYPICDKAPTSFTHAKVKTSSGRVYLAKIIKNAKRYVKLQWFNGERTFLSSTMTCGKLSIVGFTNER